MGHFARECRAQRNQERVRKESYRQGSKAEKKSSKALMAIDGVGWDWSYMADEEDHALDGKDLIDGKLARLLKSSKDLEDIIETSTSAEDQNNDTSTSEETASTNPSKPFIKFVKPKDSQSKSKIEEQEIPKKPQVKNSKQNRESNRRPKGNQRN
nr:hypothetical protein [Tanacetum cinerariifolium]